MQVIKEFSFWERDALLPRFDVLIVGSGLVGLSTAIHLLEMDSALKVGVIERAALPYGASTRNAGFACFGSMSELLADMRCMTEDEVWSLVEKRYRGLRKLRQMLGDDLLQYREVGGYELFGSEAGQAELFDSCLEHIGAWNLRMREITGLANTFDSADDQLKGMNFGNARHLIRNRAEGYLHPGKMMQGLMNTAQQQGAHFFYGVEVTDIHNEVNYLELATRQGYRLEARNVLVASNGFAAGLLADLAVQPARNQVLITAPVEGGLPWQGTFHYHEGYVYFRDVGDRVLLGGARHLDMTGETTPEFGTNDQIREFLAMFLDEVVLPGRSPAIEQWWSGIMGVGQKKSPILEAYRPNLYVAARLGGMGVALGSLLGQEAADLILQAG